MDSKNNVLHFQHKASDVYNILANRDIKINTLLFQYTLSNIVCNQNSFHVFDRFLKSFDER